MSKKAYLYPSAERLYVAGGRSVKEIVKEIGVSERTLRHWKKSGDWDKKCAEYISTKKDFKSELYIFVSKFIEHIIAEIDAGREIDYARCEIVVGLLNLLNKTSQEDEKQNDTDIPLLIEYIKHLVGEVEKLRESVAKMEARFD